MKQTRLTPAIAMIELIFAIVIMGIVMMSAPMLISTSLKSTSVVLQQEGVNQAVSRITMILSHTWDEMDTDDNCTPPVLRVTSGDNELEPMSIDPMSIDYGRRSGTPIGSKSRKFNSCGNHLNASAIGQDGGDLDDIDDFNDTSLVQIQDQGGRYIEKNTVSIATAITYGTDSADYNSTSTITFVPGSGSATSNIKNIDVSITSTHSAEELQKTIVMHAFSCNVGGIAYEMRQLP